MNVERSSEALDLLRREWLRLMERYRVGRDDAVHVFEVLAASYSAAGRHYHNLEHLEEMFPIAAHLATITDDLSVVQLAIWFHDSVYDPRAKDNESRSAELAVTLLGPIGVRRSELDRVMLLVRATDHLAASHPPGDRETAILLDADLAILGATSDRYRRYSADIRREYDWVADEDYRIGRARAIEHLLARPRLFWNEQPYREWEDRARENLSHELKGLR